MAWPIVRASIRVPHSCFVNNSYKGYLEDRRPNSQGDPYQIASQILKTVADRTDPPETFRAGSLGPALGVDGFERRGYCLRKVRPLPRERSSGVFR